MLKKLSLFLSLLLLAILTVIACVQEKDEPSGVSPFSRNHFRSLTVTKDVNVGGNLAVTGTSTLTGAVSITGTSTLTGAVTTGGALLSDTDSQDDIGSAAVRYNAGYFDELFWAKGDTVASAVSSFTLGSDGNYYVISGTAQIDSIAAQTAGKFVILQTAAACTLVDGGNLKLAGNLNATADDIISLISDGTNWHETGRSVN